MDIFDSLWAYPFPSQAYRLAPSLRDLLAELAAGLVRHVRPGGRLGLSGILSEQAEEVREAYAPWVDFGEPEFRPQDGQTWTRLTGRKRHS